MALELLKNSSLLSRLKLIHVKRFLAFYVLLLNFFCNAQIANYVTNGGFEEYYNCNGFSINAVKGWRNMDSIASNIVVFNNTCNNKVPFDGVSYQRPYKGNSFAGTTIFCPPPYCSINYNRWYFRNRLKANLQNGVSYCVKIYYNVRDNSSVGVDGLGAFFADNTIDTITKSLIPLTYLIPQVKLGSGIFAYDTMNWRLLSGNFVANGNEKHLLIGNFKSNTNTNTVVVNANSQPNVGQDIYIDHVSCIPLDLPAFAGEDKHIIPGETLYIGRQRDVGIDEACMWYKLPVTITPTTPAIDTAAGIFVNPVVTTTYVVKQDICGVIKYDTVVVFKDGVGFEKLQMLNEGLKIYPQPANEQITLSVENEKMYEGIKHLELYNNLGQLIREEELSFKEKKFNLTVSELTVGVYTIKLLGTGKEVIYKRIVINRQ